MPSKEFNFKIKFPVFGNEIRLNSEKIHGEHSYFTKKNVPIQKIMELTSLYFKKFHNPEDIWESYDPDYDDLKKDKEGNIILDKVRATFFVGFNGYARPTGEWFSQSARKSTLDLSEKIYKFFPKSYYIVGLAIEVELENPKSTPEKQLYTVRAGVMSVDINMKAEDIMLDKIKDILSEQNIPNNKDLHTNEQAKKELISLIKKNKEVIALLTKADYILKTFTSPWRETYGFDTTKNAVKNALHSAEELEHNLQNGEYNEID